MAANTTPIFPKTPVVGTFGVLLTTAMTTTKAWDGTEAAGTSMVLLGTCGADGSRIDSVRVNYTSTAGAAPSGTTNENIIRVWANNGSANTVAANNMRIADFQIPSVSMTDAITLNQSLSELMIPIFESFPTGTRIYAGLVNAVGGTNCALTLRLSAGDY